MNSITTGSPGHKWLGARTIRYFVMLILLVLGLYILSREADHLKANDFIGYWSASRILLNGGNPYSPSELLLVQKAGGLNQPEPAIVYNPPWAFPIFLVIGLFNRPIGQVLWMLAQIGAVIYSTNQIWSLYSGPTKLRTAGWIVAFTFGPVIAAILLQGQISPFILLGITGFLKYIDQTNKNFLACVFIFLASIKPQVPFLFFIAFLLWAIFNKKLQLIIGTFCIFLFSNIIIFAINPNIFSRYFQLLQLNAPTAWATPTIGTYLRLIIRPASFSLQFIAPLLGAIWMVSYWIRHRFTWDWKREMPLILFVTTISAAYIWTYDMVILLLPLLLAFIGFFKYDRRWIALSMIAGYVLIDLLYLWLHLRMDDSKFIWLAPALFIWYIVARAIRIVRVPADANQKSA